MKARPPLSRRIKDAGLETALFRRRALAGFAIIACCLAVLLARFFWLQVLQHDEFSARSDANRIKIRPLPPARGLIYDRNGVVLADNVPQYRLELTPEQAGNVSDTLTRLKRVIALSPEDVERFNEVRRLKRRFDGVLSESALMAYAGKRSVKQWQSIPAAVQNVEDTPTHPGGVIDLDRDYYGMDARLVWRWEARPRNSRTGSGWRPKTSTASSRSGCVRRRTRPQAGGRRVRCRCCASCCCWPRRIVG